MLTAVKEQGSIEIDGRQVDLTHAIATDNDRHQTRRWLWTVVLADGIRALARAGRWGDALNHARCHGGIGDTLLDGRQIAAITNAMHGNQTAARRLVTTSVKVQRWQKTVGACLDLWIRAHARQHVAAEYATVRASDLPRVGSGIELFILQTSMVFLDLAEDSTARSGIVQHLTQLVASTVDGTVARAALAHPSHRFLPATAAARLRAIRHAAAPGNLPRTQLESSLISALDYR